MQSLDEAVCFPFPLSPPVVVDQRPDFRFAAIVVVIVDLVDSTVRVDCWSVVYSVVVVVVIEQAARTWYKQCVLDSYDRSLCW